MVYFSLWDIFRNLLLAARWTVALSLIAFTGGGVVGLALLLARLARLAQLPGAQPLVAGYVQLFPGHTAADAAVLGLLRVGAGGHQCLGLGRGRRGAHALRQRVFDRDLARLRGCHPQGPVGGGRQPRAVFYRKDAARCGPAGESTITSSRPDWTTSKASPGSPCRNSQSPAGIRSRSNAGIKCSRRGFERVANSSTVSRNPDAADSLWSIVPVTPQYGPADSGADGVSLTPTVRFCESRGATSERVRPSQIFARAAPAVSRLATASGPSRTTHGLTLSRADVSLDPSAFLATTAWRFAWAARGARLRATTPVGGTHG